MAGFLAGVLFEAGCLAVGRALTDGGATRFGFGLGFEVVLRAMASMRRRAGVARVPALR